jgi:hypothetical protein
MALTPSMNDNCRHDHQSRMQSREGDAHVVTCVMSWLVYDNSMALPPWKKRKLGRVSRESLKSPFESLCESLLCRKLYILTRFTGYTCTWCV